MHSKHTRLGMAALAAVVMLSVSSVGAQKEQQKDSKSSREVFTANAVNNSNIGTPGIVRLDIAIDRWSTPGETEHLLSVLSEQGPKALLNTLQRTKPVGYIKTPESLAYDLRYAREAPGEGAGRRIVLATDRPMGFFEASQNPRTTDYPFTMIELRLNAKGQGEGTLTYATKLTNMGGILVVENYADRPIMLTNVKKEK